jgi:putative salt-induced outer membrane protein YdiY
LKNGDALTGEIVKKDGDKLTMKSAFLGEVSMPWSAVVELRSDKPLFVVLPGGRQVSGPVSVTGSDLQVTTGAGPEAAALADVSAIRNEAEQHSFERLEAPRWAELWAGFFDLGYALARGNARTTTLTTSFTGARITRTDKTSVHFNQIYATATVNRVESSTAQAIRGGWSYDHNVGPRLFFNVLNEYEHDRFQSLDLRFVAGGGIGLHALKTERTVLDILGGGDFARESFSTGLIRNSAEAYAGDELTYKLSGVTNLTQSFRIFPNLTRSGEYRMSFDLGTATTLAKFLSWQVTASDRFQTNPVFGRQRNDLLLTTGLRVSFAH